MSTLVESYKVRPESFHLVVARHPRNEEERAFLAFQTHTGHIWVASSATLAGKVFRLAEGWEEEAYLEADPEARNFLPPPTPKNAPRSKGRAASTPPAATSSASPRAAKALSKPPSKSSDGDLEPA